MQLLSAELGNMVGGTRLVGASRSSRSSGHDKFFPACRWLRNKAVEAVASEQSCLHKAVAVMIGEPLVLVRRVDAR